MAKKKVFGITANIAQFDSGEYIGEKYIGLNSDYINAARVGGAFPLMLLPCKERDEMHRQLDLIDMLLLSGGADIAPHRYGAMASPLLEKVIAERDEYEFELIALAYERKIPIFGICRGLQLINVAFGGTLYQDISEFADDHVIHRHPDPEEKCYHEVDIVKPSLLYDIFQKDKVVANSYHHQGIDKLAPGFQVNAFTKDGFIEGIEKPGDSLLVAVQWHPEMMASDDETMKNLFQNLP